MKKMTTLLGLMTCLGFNTYSNPYVYTDISAQYFGDAEEGYKTYRQNLGNEGSRIQFLTKIVDETSGDNLEIRLRDYIDTKNRDAQKAKDIDDIRITATKYYDIHKFRLRYFENFNYREVELYDLVDVRWYLPFDLPSLKKLEVGPRFTYGSEDSGDDLKLFGASLFSQFVLPANTKLNVNLYEYYIDTANSHTTGFGREFEVIFNKKLKLSEVDGVHISAIIDGGLDSYYSRTKKNYGSLSVTDKDSYSFFIMPALDISYRAIYVSIGAEYRNFGGSLSGDNKYRWQPSITIGYSKEF